MRFNEGFFALWFMLTFIGIMNGRSVEDLFFVLYLCAWIVLYKSLLILLRWWKGRI